MRIDSSFRAMVFCFLVIGLLNQSHARGAITDGCVQLSLPDEVIALTNLADDLEFHPATDLQILNAPCARKEAFTDIEMNNWLIKNQGDSNIELTVNGIHFEDESYENLEAFRNLTTFVDIQGRIDFERHKNFSSKCKKVDCALKEIFGSDISVPLLFMQRKFGMNGSHIVRKPEEAVKWKRNELDTVILGLSDMPEGLLPINKNHPLFRSSSKNSGGVIANATITIFDEWNNETAPFKRATIVHELGHSISSETRLSSSEMFKKLSGWGSKTEIVDGKKLSKMTCEHPERVVSVYGKENNDEDFAESVLAYRYNPKILKDSSPEKYELIKSTVYDGVEYTTEESCKNPKRITNKIKTSVEKALSSWTPSPYEIKEIASRCGKNIINQLFSEGRVETKSNYLESCYNDSLDQYLSAFNVPELSSLSYPNHTSPMLKNIKPYLDPVIRREVISRAKEENTSRIKKIFKEILKSEYACKPDNQKNSSMKFQQALHDKDRFRFDTELKFIVEKACLSKESLDVETIIKDTIR